MKNEDLYKSWRDKLLVLVSEQVCAQCTDERKEKYKINYANPLKCGCRCERVDKILANAQKIEEDIEKLSKSE